MRKKKTEKTGGGAAVAVALVVLLLCLTAAFLTLPDTTSPTPDAKNAETREEPKRKRETVEEEQIEVLNKIFASLNGGSGWTYSTNWGTENDPCSPQTPWYGVSCIVEGTQSVIQEIDLSDNNVSGSFPPNTLQLLSSLRFLYINDNSISGPLPIDVFNGTRLTKFIAGNNEMKGTLPETIGSLNGTLQWLDLSNNLLSGSIPDTLWSCVELQGLLLNGNGRPNTGSQGLTGTISEKVQQLQQLTVFHVDQNHLSGSLPLGLFQLPLIELFLGSNQIQGEIPDQIGQLRGTLERLDLSATMMSGTLPSTLFDLDLLQYLNLGLSRFSGPVSEAIGGLSGLQQLNLRSSPSSPFSFNGSLPSSLWSLSDLQFLYLSNNRFTGSLGLVSNLTMLQVLDVSSNQLNGSLSDAMFQGSFPPPSPL